METKANYVIVGTFAVGLVLSLLAFTWWILAPSSGPDSARLDIIIEGSVSGLEVGSPVKFNGIDIGQVTRIRFDESRPNVVVAETRIRETVPVRPSTRAFLGVTSLTGLAHIELEGGDPAEQTLFQLAESTGAVPTKLADASAFNDILASAQDIFTRAESVMDEVERFVADARAPLTTTLENTEVFSKALADNADEIDTFLANVGKVGDSLSTVSDDLEALVQSVNGMVAAVEPARIESIVANVDQFTAELTAISTDVGALVDTAESALGEFETIGETLNASAARIDRLLADIPDGAVSESVTNFADASQAVRDAAQDVAGVTTIFEERRADIDATVANVAQMAERLNAASERVDAVLASLDGFLGEGNAGDLIGDVSETLTSFKQVADTLNRRLDGITAGMERFSERGLRDVESLISETRRSISRIEGAISDLERDPQRLLFGGEGTVKRFDGRQRR